MSKVFVDSSAFFAIANRNDTYHAEAVALMQRLAHVAAELFTSNFVIAETHALLLSKLGYTVAVRFLHEMNTGITRRIRVSETDEKRAQEIIFRYSDKTFSYTDATSFAVMERLHIKQSFTFDGDFDEYGFVRFT